eukprot:TRINITY_DN16221_c0_g1_i2.p1 TRINITY_DN16221_c0_g1~~TRINITY_DN16221_c0_g1_i2.p1  ORF type:complete len:418 (+),score=45.90 TRINITY_DN16221_c0_g1_i2:160-1413(+)
MTVIFMHNMPECGGERLLSFDAGYRGSPRRERVYHAVEWAIELIRRLHTRILSSASQENVQASQFYIPTFFGLLMALHDTDSLECLAMSCAALSARGEFKRNAGYDHFYLHGLEHPVLATLDYAKGISRTEEKAATKLFHAVYATLQNVALVATGDLSQGTLAAALGGALYGMRRIVTVPFAFDEDCEGLRVHSGVKSDVFVRRDTKLTFVGSVQAYNHERVMFLQAAIDAYREHAIVSPYHVVVDTPSLRVRARMQLDAGTAPLNASERAAIAAWRRGGYLQRLYRRSEMCVVAPGDAPVLGQRLSDVISAGCVPVVLYGPGTYPLLPLQGAVQWEKFAIMVQLGDLGALDAIVQTRHALHRLLRLPRTWIAGKREALLTWRPRLALGLGHGCKQGHSEFDSSLRPDAADLALEDI